MFESLLESSKCGAPQPQCQSQSTSTSANGFLEQLLKSSVIADSQPTHNPPTTPQVRSTDTNGIDVKSMDRLVVPIELMPKVVRRERKTTRPYAMINRNSRSPPRLRPKTWAKMMDTTRIQSALETGCKCKQHCGQQFDMMELVHYRQLRAAMGEVERKQLLLSELVAMGAAHSDIRYNINGKRCCREFFAAAGEQTSLLKVCVPLARHGFTKVTRRRHDSPKLKESWVFAVLFLKFSTMCDKTQVSTLRAGRPGLKGRNWHLPRYVRVGYELLAYVVQQWELFCATSGIHMIHTPD